MQHAYRGDPEILKVKTTAESAYTAGDGWHTDVTCDEIPPLGSMLYVTETPASGGGDTDCSRTCTSPTSCCPSRCARSWTA